MSRLNFFNFKSIQNYNGKDHIDCVKQIVNVALGYDFNSNNTYIIGNKSFLNDFDNVMGIPIHRNSNIKVPALISDKDNNKLDILEKLYVDINTLVKRTSLINVSESLIATELPDKLSWILSKYERVGIVKSPIAMYGIPHDNDDGSVSVSTVELKYLIFDYNLNHFQWLSADLCDRSEVRKLVGILKNE